MSIVDKILFSWQITKALREQQKHHIILVKKFTNLLFLIEEFFIVENFAKIKTIQKLYKTANRKDGKV